MENIFTIAYFYLNNKTRLDFKQDEKILISSLEIY